jgi:hypothetical protein
MALKTLAATILVIGLSAICVYGETDPRKAEQSLESNLSVDWKSLSWQTSLSLGVMHGFRIATEPGTRDELKGPFFADYFRTLGNLHGWSDGDEGYVNYLAHPMEGAVAGFMFVQNDRKYRRVEYGANASYWKSRLRAAAFAWAYSEQFEIGPVSEASLGNIQSYYPAYGFVDHVVTPVIGLGWIVAEDALDRFVVKRIESRVSNPWVRALARAWLNPARSYANFMAFRRPWERDTRLGVTEYDPSALQMAQAPGQRSIGQTDTASSALLPGTGPHNTAPDMGRFPRKIPTFELTAHYDFFHNSPKDSQSGSCHGGGVTAALALNRWASVVADVSGCQMSLSGPNLSGDSLTYLFGPRFTYRKGDRWSFYMNMLLGGQKLTQEQIFPERIPTGDLTEWNRLDAWVRHAQITEVSEANAFAVSVGGGLDLSINRALAIRIGNIDHLWTSIGDFNNISYARGFRFSSGAVLRFGNW